MAQQKRSRNEFRRTNLKDGKNHPTYIYAKVGDKYEYLGITHAKITKGVKNIRLEKNPNPQDKRTVYVRPTSQKAHQSSFGAKLKGWFFSDSDKEKIERLKK